MCIRDSAKRFAVDAHNVRARRYSSRVDVERLAARAPRAPGTRITQPDKNIIRGLVRERPGPREITVRTHVARVPLDGGVRVIGAIDTHLVASMCPATPLD